MIASMGARRGGGVRAGRRPPPPPLENGKNILGLYWWPFCYFFFIWGPFCYVFLILGAFSPCGGLFATFYFMVEAFFGACPPPPPPPTTTISADTHDCKKGSRACSQEICLCERNLVSSGHVCYDFALKMTKIMINCSHVVVPARWVWRHAISRKMLVNAAIWSVFWYDFSLRKF